MVKFSRYFEQEHNERQNETDNDDGVGREQVWVTQLPLFAAQI